MIGVDTNVLVRHIVQDDAVQSAAASRFFAARSDADPAFISQVVLAETVWVLASAYRFGADRLRHIVRALLTSRDVVIQRDAPLRRALADWADTDADLADAIIAHAAIDAGCDGIVTFDKRAQRLPGMLPVS